MLLKSPLILDGVLELEGALGLLFDSVEPKFPVFNIKEGMLVECDVNQEYFLSNGLILDGVLKMEGLLSLGA